jgi:hypothetical protein
MNDANVIKALEDRIQILEAHVQVAMADIRRLKIATGLESPNDQAKPGGNRPVAVMLGLLVGAVALAVTIYLFSRGR